MREMTDIRVEEALSTTDLDTFRDLNKHYLTWLNEDLGFQSIDQEMQNLPGNYDRNKGGCILLAYSMASEIENGDDEKECVGVVALRPLRGKHLEGITEVSGIPIENICEMKRLFVMPQWQRRGIGMKLVEDIQEKAKELGYSGMVLDTLERLTASNSLYRKAGFQNCPAYNICPLEGPLWFFKNIS